jgi:putative acetyltransferase
MPDLKIRPACSRDLDDIAALQTRSIMVFGIETYGEVICAAWAKIGVQVRHTLLESGTFFVAERNGAITGVAGWTADSREPNGAWPRYVFVVPEAAGCGIGRRLMDQVETSASFAGRPNLQLWASLNAVSFYRALGYQAIKPVRWPIAAGIEMDFLLMTKAGQGAVTLPPSKVDDSVDG